MFSKTKISSAIREFFSLSPEKIKTDIEKLKEFLNANIIIKKENIPHNYFELQQKIARNLGHENINITDNFKEEKFQTIIKDQKDSLNKWITYLCSADANYSPLFKAQLFSSILKAGSYNKKKKSFYKRSMGTVANFPICNSRAIAELLNELFKKKQSFSFSKKYAEFLAKFPAYTEEGLEEIRGKWKKYNQGEKPDLLVKSLDGYPLEWCTSAYSTAETQLQTGDFYVYYSIDQNGKPVIPRIAIRMSGKFQIAEVRGIAKNQQMDPYILPIVEDKMKSFGSEGDKYIKKSSDMKKLTSITEKTDNNEKLTKEELSFIYEINSNITGFGYHKDPRIEKIIKKRNIKKDCSIIFNCGENQISTTKKEALRGNIKYHYGSLILDSLTSAKNLILPEKIGENLYLDSLTSAEGLVFPKELGGGLDLGSLTSAKNLTLPEKIEGSLDLGSLTSAKNLTLPEKIEENLYLYSLTSAEGLVFPKELGGSLNFRSLTSTKKEKIRKKYPKLLIF